MGESLARFGEAMGVTTHTRQEPIARARRHAARYPRGVLMQRPDGWRVASRPAHSGDMPTDSGQATRKGDVYSDGERLWRAKPGATSTFDENVAARELFIDLHHDEYWNPWRIEEHAAELERAQQIMEQWERAEPNFRRTTKRQLDAEMTRWNRDFKRKQERRERERQEKLKRYDPSREQDRLELLEQQCLLAHKTDEVAKLRSGEAFPAMSADRRATQVAELDEAIERHRAAVDRLKPAVGDPEDVPDQYGRLPRDRRHSTLYRYRERRIEEVREIRALLPDLEAQIKGTDDKALRSKLRAERDIKTWRLDKLLAVPRLEAEDMCADCATPADKHGYVSPPFDYPCPAWPGQRRIHAEVMKMLETFQRRREDGQSDTPAKPKPEPLAVVPSGLPIGEVVARLQQLQAKHPDAEVRRGRANHWELWPAQE